MATDELKEIVVHRDQATFWLDRWGYWCNAHGRFEHKKIIDYFHAAIGCDEGGYFVSQINGSIREKVYFRYEDTALFVVDALGEADIILVLNTRKRIAFDPETLFIRGDFLYLEHKGEIIKFSERGMLKISPFLENEGKACLVSYHGKQMVIPERKDDVL